MVENTVRWINGIDITFQSIYTLSECRKLIEDIFVNSQFGFTFNDIYTAKYKRNQSETLVKFSNINMERFETIEQRSEGLCKLLERFLHTRCNFEYTIRKWGII